MRSFGRRLILLMLTFLALCVLCALLLIGYVYVRETHLPPVVESDVIIVLGAQVLPDGTPSVALERRLTVALESYEASPQLIITCGAQGIDEPRAEGEVMRDWLIERGVSAQDVISETNSFNTRENLRFARAIMEEHDFSQALIVTSDYHVARALELCKQEGICATGKGSPSKPEYFLKNHLREGLSWIKLWLETLLGWA